LKRIPWPIAVIVLIVALFFAYRSFVASFFPRLGQHTSGPPPMPPEAMRQMAEHNKKQAQAKADKAKKAGAATASQNAASERPKTQNKKGGD